MTTQTEALKMAIENLEKENSRHEIEGLYSRIIYNTQAINACKEALHSQEQEPVAWTDLEGNFTSNPKELFWYPYALYTHPKEWQELSDDEIDDIFKNHRDESLGRFSFARAILAKAKEKNKC